MFSIDLEDVRTRIPHGERYKERVPANTSRFLGFLEKHRVHCTFFVVGELARRYPSLIKEILDAGHELACHSDVHHTLNTMTPDSFRDDLSRNLDALRRAGVSALSGYRAPTFSLTQRSAWVYDVLGEMGFRYSSSVLPASNPLFGWRNFGTQPRIMGKVWEVPMSVGRILGKDLPFGGGVYFRTLPFGTIKKHCRNHFSSGSPVLGYFHPYDLDTEQERFMHPEINGNLFYNSLLYFNRKNTLSRLERIIGEGATIVTYSEFVETHLRMSA